MTTIDVVFAFFYIMAGISLISIVFVQFYPEYYDLAYKAIKILITSIDNCVRFLSKEDCLQKI
ncbi:MAG: hypothetical protein CM15mP126_6750 [Gammaproteobacteria bacterium]|nr:MAG: hypothetical protein CM15mP126_6750 [Gammaproteobacteria bacterium]